jgi:hypothetical protein
MSNRKNAGRGLVLNIACATLLLGFSGVAAADQFGVQVAVGLGDHHVRKLDLGLVWDPDLTWWQIGDWHFALIGEAHAAWWHSDEGNVHENIGEIGVTPIIRFIKRSGSVRPFIEAGAGVPLLSSPRFLSTFTLSTAFQFADMAGVGMQFGSHPVPGRLPLSACFEWRYQGAESWYKISTSYTCNITSDERGRVTRGAPSWQETDTVPGIRSAPVLANCGECGRAPITCNVVAQSTYEHRGNPTAWHPPDEQRCPLARHFVRSQHIGIERHYDFAYVRG